MPCCGSAPTECACALLLPVFGGTYDYAGAQAAVSGVASCILFGKEAFDTPWTSLVASNPAQNQVDSEVVFDPETQAFFTGYISITVPEGTTLSLDYSFTQMTVEEPPPPDVTATLLVYSCSWELVGSDSDTGPTSGTLFVGPLAAGTYYIGMVSESSVDSQFTLMGDEDFAVNPVIALWDDSGTTRQLEACPKMLLPALTENTGDWYASCADAASAIGTFVSNCVGYNDAVSATDYTATDGGTSLTFTRSVSSPDSFFNTGNYWGSVNAETGETLVFTWSVTYDVPGTATASVDIYDNSGVLVESISGGSSPLTSAVLPYTGRYICRLSIVSDFPASMTNATIAITSSGVLSVNQVQAFYDVGLDCPGRLNCGDSCP